MVASARARVCARVFESVFASTCARYRSCARARVRVRCACACARCRLRVRADVSAFSRMDVRTRASGRVRVAVSGTYRLPFLSRALAAQELVAAEEDEADAAEEFYDEVSMTVQRAVVRSLSLSRARALALFLALSRALSRGAHSLSL
eukprot:3892725-Pleurochrysis_carterae.AAC.1